MNWKHFLGVLLMGGSMAAGCGSTARSSSLVLGDGASEGQTEGAGGAGGAGGSPGGTGAAEPDAGSDARPDGEALQPCLCSPTRCCDQHEGAPATVQMGLACCWGTSC